MKKRGLFMEWWQTLLISLASAIASALITGYFTWLSERNKQKRSEQEKRACELQAQYETRPRLELKKFKDLSKGKIESKSDFECLLINFIEVKPSGESLFFVYDSKAIEKSNLCCVEYEFVNTGKTEIDSICVTSNQPRTTSIFELDCREFFIKNGLLSYDAWSRKRFIKPGETISIKVCYVKEQIIYSPLSCVATIYMEDINGHLWRQPFFCPTSEMENSKRTNRREFNDIRDTRSAFECFKHPELL